MNFEFTILDFLQTIHLPWLDGLMIFITSIANKGIVFFIFAGILLLFPKHRKSGICILLALAVEFITCNIILKPMLHRIRPYTINPSVDTLIRPPRDFSFPSGHTGASFAVAFALFFKKDRLWIPTAILATLIGFTRLYLYIHFPTDVLGGVLIGILSGYIGSWLNQKIADIRKIAN